MNLSDERPYHPLLRALHWLMAAGLIANFALGVSVHEMPLSPQKLQWMTWHKWAGISLLGLVSLRLLTRLLTPMPAPLPAPAWQAMLAQLNHLALYTLMFAIPLSGWMVSSAAGIPVVYLGWFELPALLPKTREWVDALKDIHEALNQGLLALVILHVAAALKHHVIDHDSTLSRMIPKQKK